jgi:hypothetical protein
MPDQPSTRPLALFRSCKIACMAIAVVCDAAIGCAEAHPEIPCTESLMHQPAVQDGRHHQPTEREIQCKLAGRRTAMESATAIRRRGDGQTGS